MNLNKYTKAELISKMKKLSNNNSNSQNNLTYGQLFLNTIIQIKSILLKLTIITLLIKAFKRYSLVRKLF